MAYLHVGLEIVFAGAAEGAHGALMALDAGVDHHVSLPVALPLNDQATHRALKRLSSIVRRAWERSERMRLGVTLSLFLQCREASCAI